MRSYTGKMMNITAAVFIWFVSLLLFNASATAVDSRTTLVLLGNEALPPISYNDNGTPKGVAVDIAKVAEKGKYQR